MPDASLPEPFTMTRSKGRATTSASSASANPEMVVARKVHFVLQRKGGVGKTFAANRVENFTAIPQQRDDH